ncbi:MAG: helix-turn-helix domain-containing protein [Roseburia inulinivorans]
MSERLKKLRKALDLTQQEFADRLGIKRNTVAQYEIGRNEPIDAVIISICREFDVNEEWLRTGKGDMFLPLDRNADIARLTKLLLNEESDSFKNRFISMLANLSVEEWEFLERKAMELAEKKQD